MTTLAPPSLRGATRRSNPECRRGEILDCFRLRPLGFGGQVACARNDVERVARTHSAMRKLPVVHIFSCVVGQITTIIRTSRSTRGAFRDRHGRWKRDAMDAVSHETKEDIADGEVVWSWCSDAGASFCEMTQGYGDNKARSHRGEHEEAVKTIAQGRPGVRLVPGVLPRAFLLHADHGCDGHPAFPAPSFSNEGGIGGKTRAIRAARTRIDVVILCAAHPSRRARRALLRMRSNMCGDILDPRGEEARQRRLEPRGQILPTVCKNAI